MGKRKLNDTSFYQCEWTGFPMKSAHCYMPSWSPTGKLMKKGSYCNWESVIAHGNWLLNHSEIHEHEHQKISEHVEFVTGVNVSSAPHFNELSHTKGDLDVHAFHAACAMQTGPITAVKISPNGEIFELLLSPVEGKFDFNSYMHKPYNHLMVLSTFHSMRKKGTNKNTDRDLTVWYYPTRDLTHNPTASNLFKMQLYGDILLVQQSREACFLPRERFVSFNKAQFEEQFTKKRRKATAEPPSLSREAYDTLKEQMQATLNSYEQRMSSTAVDPKTMSNTQTMVQTSGRKLAEKLKERGVVAPPLQVH